MLWAGVPMLTVAGDNWPSRVATCLAFCVDMPQMVMQSLEEYEETAVRLAHNPAELAEWRSMLASRRLSAPLFDTERWVRSFEDGFHQMWDQWIDKKQDRDALQDINCQDFGMSPSGESACKSESEPRERECVRVRLACLVFCTRQLRGAKHMCSTIISQAQSSFCATHITSKRIDTM